MPTRKKTVAEKAFDKYVAREYPTKKTQDFLLAEHPAIDHFLSGWYAAMEFQGRCRHG